MVPLPVGLRGGMVRAKQVVVVCGGRDLLTPTGPSSGHAAQVAKLVALWAPKLAAELAFMWNDSGGYHDVVVIHGGAKGADWLAGKVAESLGLEVSVYPADWATHGKAAGPLRNEEMAKVADICIALPGGRGTEDMKNRMRHRNKRVIELTNAHLHCS